MFFSRKVTRSNLHWGKHILAEGWRTVCRLKQGGRVAAGRQVQGLWQFRPVRCSLAYLFPRVTLAGDKTFILTVHSRCALCVSSYYYLQLEIKSLKLIHQEERVCWRERISWKGIDTGIRRFPLDGKEGAKRVNSDTTAERRGGQTEISNVMLLWHMGCLFCQSSSSLCLDK